MSERDNPKRHLPPSGEEKFAAFIIYLRALEAAGLSPGYGRIQREDARGIDFAFGLPNFMVRDAILTAPETVAEAAEILAQNAASAIEAPSGGETRASQSCTVANCFLCQREADGSTEGESAVGATGAETPNPSHRSTGE